MTVYFEEEGAYQLPFDCRKLAEKVIAEQWTTSSVPMKQK